MSENGAFVISSTQLCRVHLGILTGGKLCRGAEAKVNYVDMFEHQQLKEKLLWVSAQGEVTKSQGVPNSLGDYIEFDNQGFYVPNFARTDIKFGYAITAKGDMKVEAICLKRSSKNVGTEFVTSKGVAKNFTNIGKNLVMVETDQKEKFVLELPEGCNYTIPVACK